MTGPTTATAPRPARYALVAALLALVVAVGCRKEAAPPGYVARVGDVYLTREELDAALAAMPPRQDSVEARQQVVEQWITNELLYEEALNRGLHDDPDVRRLLEESQRSVLVSALISKLYEENPATPSPAELQAYYEQNKEHLRLLEPFVRVRYLAARTPDAADAVRRALLAAPEAAHDSLWLALVAEHAVDPEGSRMLAENYVAESRLFVDQPALRQVLLRMSRPQVAPVVVADSLYHVLQLAARVPAGTIPEPAWIEEELTRRLLISGRKQLYARQVQRLRTEALAREELEIRP